MNRSSCCNCLSLVLSVLSGIAAGLLLNYSLIPEYYLAAWVAFTFAAVALFFFLVILVSNVMRSPIIHDCVCCHGLPLVISAIGTLFFTIALIAAEACNLYFVIVLAALGAFFFTMLLLEIGCLAYCILRNHCGCPCNPCN